MKHLRRCLSLALCAVLLLGLMPSVQATYDPNTDYMALMMEAAGTGDYAAGRAAEACRNEKIAALGIGRHIAFDDLYLLAKVMYAEAGSSWLSEDWKLRVGEVVMNRVASPEFPNSVREVVYQPGQYAGSGNAYWERLMPDARCVALALRLLEGERRMEPAVVFQANFPQGSGIHTQLYDPLLGNTYFCYSHRMGLYADAEVMGSIRELAFHPLVVC